MHSRLGKRRLLAFFSRAAAARNSINRREWALLAEEDPWEAYEQAGFVSGAINREMLELPNGGALYVSWAELQDVFETGKTPIPEAHAALRRASELWLRRPEAPSAGFLSEWLDFARQEAGFFFDRDGDCWHEPASRTTQTNKSVSVNTGTGEALSGVMRLRPDLRIEMIAFDYSVTLWFDSGAELKIEQPFELTTIDEPGLTITPGVLAQADQVLRALLWRTVVSLTIQETGSLAFMTADGCVVEVSPDTDYEAWTFHDGAGFQAVSVAGGGVAVWRGKGA